MKLQVKAPVHGMQLKHDGGGGRPGGMRQWLALEPAVHVVHAGMWAWHWFGAGDSGGMTGGGWPAWCFRLDVQIAKRHASSFVGCSRALGNQSEAD